MFITFVPHLIILNDCMIICNIIIILNNCVVSLDLKIVLF